MGRPVTLSYVTLPDLERSKSRSLQFRSIISRKGAVRAYITININMINRKSYMGSPLMQLCVTSGTLKGQHGQGQGHSDLESLYLVKELI